jgi:chromosome segregation ATPase
MILWLLNGLWYDAAKREIFQTGKYVHILSNSKGRENNILIRPTIKIDGKEVRKADLLELMKCMSIDISNPAVVLHQDSAKSFGECNDGKSLYKYFLDATGLRQSLDECERCKKQVLADRANLKQCIEVQKKLEEGDFAAAKEEMDKCCDLNALGQKIEELKADLSVLTIYETVLLHDEHSQELSEYRQSMAQLQSQLASLQQQLNDMRAEVETVEQRGNVELVAEMDSIRQQLQHLQKKAQGYGAELNRSTAEKTQVEQYIRKIEKQIKDEENSREEARREFERLDRSKGKRAAAKLKDEAETLLQRTQDRQAELQSLEGETEECEHDLKRIQSQFEELKSSISNIDELIRKNRSSRGRVISRDEMIRRYNSKDRNPADLVQVRNALDIAQKRGMFRGSPPLGPLGMHITLKPEGRIFYRPIAQALGSKLLGAFLFHSFEDREAFKNCKEFQSIPNNGSLTLWVLPSSAHNEPECTPTFQALPGVSTHLCLDLITFDNVWVKNAALQFAKLDRNQVVEHYDKSLAHKALESIRGKRSGLSVTVRAIDGHECNAASSGGVSSTTNSASIPQDIFDRPDTFDAEASLREMEAEKQHLSRDYQRIEKERRSLSDRLKQIKDREQRIQSEIAMFQKKRKQNLEEARDLEMEAEQHPQEFDDTSFADNIRNKQSTLETRNRDLARLTNEIDAIGKSIAENQSQIKRETEKREVVEKKLQSI